MNLLGLRFTVSEDAVRLLADARTALAAADEYGLTMYSAPPFFLPARPGSARIPHRQWADVRMHLRIPRNVATHWSGIIANEKLVTFTGIGWQLSKDYAGHGYRFPRTNKYPICTP